MMLKTSMPFKAGIFIPYFLKSLGFSPFSQVRLNPKVRLHTNTLMIQNIYNNNWEWRKKQDNNNSEMERIILMSLKVILENWKTKLKPHFLSEMDRHIWGHRKQDQREGVRQILFKVFDLHSLKTALRLFLKTTVREKRCENFQCVSVQN